MDKHKFNAEEIGLIQRTMMPGASPDDVAWFIKTCERTGLDPFARQIMPTSRNSRQPNGDYKTTWSSLTTIDGLRKIAVDSGDYEGQEGPWWCGEDGEWKEVWTKKTPCLASRVLVHRKNFKTGMVGIAKYESYVQRKKDGNPNNVWAQLGDHMTAKCAEALGLRRAYPNEMAGLYTDDEMEQVLQLEKQETDGNHETTKPSHEDGTTGFTASVIDQGWDIPAQETFAAGMEALYALYKQQEKNEDYLILAEQWKTRMKDEGSAVVLKDLGTFIEFMGLSFRLKTILKNGGKEEEYPKQHEKWAARLAKDPPAEVIAGLNTFVTKCENAKSKGAK